jgi:hypothetical protein
MTAYNAQPVNVLAKGTGSGQNEGKFLYWWVANPFNENATVDQDLNAANWWWHLDKDPKNPYYDNTKPCIPGVDYLRRVGQRNAANIAICVDQSRQANANGQEWFWMHGNGSTNPKKGWKNELFGDGHVDMVRPDAVVKRWAADPNAAGW